ncbi:polymorphic toxin-type HINT domain-containing protein [Streptomyces aculeolatus]
MPRRGDCYERHGLLWRRRRPRLAGPGSHPDLDIGDKVVVTDPETGKTTIREIVATISTEDDKEFVDLKIKADGRATTLASTTTHPFWVREKNDWVNAGDLAPGQTLRTSAGTTATIEGVRYYTKRQRTHDLTLNDIHTYYVLAGQTPVLVHNSGGCIPWSSGSVSRASKSLADGATSVTVKSRSEAEELFLRTYQGEGYRNASGMDSVGTKQYYGTKRGTYHWDDQLGEDGRVLGHGAGNRDGDFPHLQVHTFDGPIVRIFWEP